jgi:prostaglandin-E synthase 1
MQPILGTTVSPVFLPYAITCVVLTLNLLLLWISCGVIRAMNKFTINVEDGASYGVPVSEIDPPAVARALRAHRNAEAIIYPFLLLGLVYVLAGGRVWIALPIFAIFTFSRLAHSIFYLRAKQPWRTVAFAVSLGTRLVLMLAVLRGLLTNRWWSSSVWDTTHARRMLSRRKMEVHLFKGTGRVFGFTADSSGANLSLRCGPWSPFKVLDMNRDGSPIPGVNVEDCLNDIERYGLHVTDAHVRITESVL